MADERVPRPVLHGVRHEGGGILRLYLDCDTGIDDALAIAYLLACPRVTLAGVGTAAGNTSAGQAGRNTLGLLHLAGRPDIPVCVGGEETGGEETGGEETGGEETGGDGESRGGGAEPVHGSNGVGGVTLPAGGPADPRAPWQLLIDLAREHPGELHVLVTGPATNVARALRESPELPGLVASVTVMGGAVRAPGNITPRAEANIRNDPRAAATVLAAPWPVTLVPLDVTMRHRWTEDDRAALRAGGTPLHETLAAMLPAYFASYESRTGIREIPLHDPLAAAIAVGEVTPADAPELPLRVDAEGGVREDQTAASRVRVVLALDSPAGPVILRRILADAESVA
ncbi:nucleoside hydrolase [Actinoplanes sp. CA-030573]|uniref:nucleoside hydrolase n=1 Tax=Actinoplanes sp. CA-030573 TaxID=3239898 RepID=UPI003D8B02A3